MQPASATLHAISREAPALSRFERLKALVLEVPEVAAWPQMTRLIARAGHREGISVWEYPVAACVAAGGSEERALPGAAAIFCALLSIHLVDDLLDEDPAGDYHRIGAGAAANLATAFQATAHRLLERADVAAGTRAELQARLAGAFLSTAQGQSLDAIETSGEPGYWQRVEAKTPPLFAGALAIGALLAGAPAASVAGLDRLGRWLGRSVQVSDDLSDALKAPAEADWARPRNNLALLYALVAGHDDRDEFERLAGRVHEPEALAAAQRILLKSGAVSYCVHTLVESLAAARRELALLDLPFPAAIEALVEGLTRPVDYLLAAGGLESGA